jgi:hypothetical protein
MICGEARLIGQILEAVAPKIAWRLQDVVDWPTRALRRTDPSECGDGLRIAILNFYSCCSINLLRHEADFLAACQSFGYNGLPSCSRLVRVAFAHIKSGLDPRT